MEDKSLGIIGGMGPKATSVFFDKIVESTDAHRDQDHINIMILNHATIPDRTTTILNKTDDLFLAAISKDIKLLEKAEVSNIAIPCNTSHYFYDKIQEMTHIPIINMVEETIKKIYNQYGQDAKVGIMATNGTINSGVYEKFSKKYGVQLQIPEEDLQEQIMDIIYNKVKGNLDVEVKEVDDIVYDFIYKKECSCVILACTELSCIRLNPDVAKYCVDAMEVLVEKSIERSGKQVKNHKIADFLADSFNNDVYVRELRLTYEELEYAKKKYPNASFKILSKEDLDGKLWCEVNLIPDNEIEEKSVEKIGSPVTQK